VSAHLAMRSPGLLHAAIAFFALVSPISARAAGPDIGTHQITLIHAGFELEFSGGMGAGSADELSRALDANPAVRVVHLNSPGGLVGEGRQMLDLIRHHLLITTTDSYCLSACTLAFIGGRERYLAPGARLGFHGEFSDTISDTQVQAYERRDMATMISLGIASDFVDKAFAVPKDHVWVPSVGELEDAHVINGVSTDYVIEGNAPSADASAAKSGGGQQPAGGDLPAVEETPGGVTIYRGPGQ
jgi:hypothetical protein